MAINVSTMNQVNYNQLKQQLVRRRAKSKNGSQDIQTNEIKSS